MRKWLADWLEREKGRGGKSELARRLGIPASAVTNILKGSRQIKASEVEPLAKFMGWTEQDVLRADGDHKDVKKELSPGTVETANEPLTPSEQGQFAADNGGGETYSVEGHDMTLTKNRVKRLLAKYPPDVAARMVDDIIDELEAEAQRDARLSPPKGA